MKSMFNECKSLKTLDMPNFDTSSVTNMEKMFNECNLIEEIKFSNYNTSLVTNMNEMFNNCLHLIKLDISNFDTYQVENMYHIFNGCNSIRTFEISNLILYKLKTPIRDLFGDLENNLVMKNMYEAIKKIKDEENIIKDIDFNIIMEVIIFPNIYSSTHVVSSFFDIKKISKSNMYVDGEEVELNNEVNLETNK